MRVDERADVASKKRPLSWLWALCRELAIRLFGRQAEIDQTRCNRCYLCMEVCPQGAIVEAVAAPVEELQATIIFLKQKTDELIDSIERLKYCSSPRAKN